MSLASAGRGAVALLERDRELKQVDALLASAVAGHGSFLVIEGGGGIGKTALLTEVQARARSSGMQVYAGRGTELESEFAFGIVRQLFEPEVRRRGKELLRGAAAPANLVVGDGQSGNAASEFALLHALYWLLADLAAKGPVLLTVDDAHWSDVDSLRWLAYLLNRVDGVPVLAALAARPGWSGPSREALAVLLAEPRVLAMRLGSLHEESVTALLAEGLKTDPEPEFVAACYRVTGGNPLALRGVVHDLAEARLKPTKAAAVALGERVPGTIARQVEARLVRLPRPARQVARALSVLGDGAELKDVAALAGLDGQEASVAADELAEADLLAPERPPHFVHPLLRAAVYDEMSQSVRTALHQGAADLLAATAADSEAVAAHLLRCELFGSAASIERLRAAALLALRRGAPEAATTYLHRALAGVDDGALRGAVLAELGRAEALARKPTAVQHLRQALDMCASPVERGALRREIAAIFLDDGQQQQCRDMLEAAHRELLGQEPDEATRIEVAVMGLSLMDPGHASSVGESFSRRLRTVATGGGPAARPARLTLAWNLAMRGEPRSEVLPHVEWCLLDKSFLSEETSDSDGATFAALALYHVDELTKAVEWTTDMVDDAVRRGAMTGLIQGLGIKAWAEHRSGRLAEARADAEEALDLARQHSLFQAPVAAALLADVLVDLGQVTQASALIEQVRIPPHMVGTAPEACLCATRGRVRYANRKEAEGIADLRRCGNVLRDLQWWNPTVYPWRPALALAVAGGAPDEAKSLVATELELARRTGISAAMGVALRTAAALEAGPSSVDQLIEAVDLLERSPAILELARTLIDLGVLLRRRNHRVDARGPLLNALEIATTWGAVGLADRARAEALVAGARPRRPRLRGVNALTPGEVRVARLAAEGRSNREIAQALFITEKTVKDHLGNTYSKLGIGSRRELDAALAQWIEPPSS